MRRLREEAAGQRGDLGPGASQCVEIATVAALLRNDNVPMPSGRTTRPA
jgi:hypothetical protein